MNDELGVGGRFVSEKTFFLLVMAEMAEDRSKPFGTVAGTEASPEVCSGPPTLDIVQLRTQEVMREISTYAGCSGD